MPGRRGPCAHGAVSAGVPAEPDVTKWPGSLRMSVREELPIGGIRAIPAGRLGFGGRLNV